MEDNGVRKPAAINCKVGRNHPQHILVEGMQSWQPLLDYADTSACSISLQVIKLHKLAILYQILTWNTSLHKKKTHFLLW